ncbi:MAG: hypothetical protein IKD58_03850 [Loktanella sp.]|nr:hypothetical protein [Loktanella sp.]
MTFFSANTPTHRLGPQPLWRSVLRSVIALIDGETVTRRNIASQSSDLPMAPATCDLIAPSLVHARDIYVIDFDDGSLLEQVDEVALWAASVTQVADVDTVMALILPESPEDVLVIINIDTMGDTENAVERLLALKLACPDVPVVIGSATFSRNNFTQQRRAITDASVRLPCGSAALALAIESSVMNSKR